MNKICRMFILGSLIGTLFSSAVYAQPTPSDSSQNVKIAKQTTSIKASGITYLNMPLQEYGGETQVSSITLNNIDLNNKKIEISGEIQSNSISYPFSISAETYRGYLKNLDNLSIINTSVTGDFELLHATFYKDAKYETLASQKTDLVGKPVLSLYFKRKDTREVVFYDIDLSNYPEITKKLKVRKDEADIEAAAADVPIEKQDPNQIKDDVKKNKEIELNKRRDNDYWFRQLFEPKVYKIPTNSGKSSKDPSVSTASTVCYQVVGCKDTSFSYVYEYTGQPGQVTDEVIEWGFKAEQSGPTTFYGNINITRTYTDCTWDAYDDPNFSALTLGHFDNSDGQIYAVLHFNGSDSSTNPWGDTIVEVSNYGTTTQEYNPKTLLQQLVRKKPNWFSALWVLGDYILSGSSQAAWNGPAVAVYDSGDQSNKTYDLRLDDRRMGTVNNTFSIKTSLRYRPQYQGNLCKYTLDFGVYTRNGFGYYDTKLAQKSIYYELWYSYN